MKALQEMSEESKTLSKLQKVTQGEPDDVCSVNTKIPQ